MKISFLSKNLDRSEFASRTALVATIAAATVSLRNVRAKRWIA